MSGCFSIRVNLNIKLGQLITQEEEHCALD